MLLKLKCKNREQLINKLIFFVFERSEKKGKIWKFQVQSSKLIKYRWIRQQKIEWSRISNYANKYLRNIWKLETRHKKKNKKQYFSLWANYLTVRFVSLESCKFSCGKLQERNWKDKIHLAKKRYQGVKKRCKRDSWMWMSLSGSLQEATFFFWSISSRTISTQQ